MRAPLRVVEVAASQVGLRGDGLAVHDFARRLRPPVVQEIVVFFGLEGKKVNRIYGYGGSRKTSKTQSEHEQLKQCFSLIKSILELQHFLY